MYKLTKNDADMLSSMIFVFSRCTERALEVLEKYFEQEYMKSEDFKLLVKKFGKTNANKILHDTNKRILRHDEKNRFNNWLECAERLHNATDRLTENCINPKYVEDNSITTCDLFNYMQESASLMCRIFVMVGNIPEEDIVRMESTIKLMGKERHNDIDILDFFRPII